VLIFAHVFLYLMPPAAAGSSSALISLVLYLATGIAYLVLRLRLYLQTRDAILGPAQSARIVP
jgi:hypothetical protein